MKYEWRKEEKEYYLPKEISTLVTIPKATYICIKGKGNPNQEDFQNRITCLYQISYTIKMMPKKGIIPNGYFDYTVYPLEGLWDMTEKGKQGGQFNKDELLYTIMIKQPSFVDYGLFEKALLMVKEKHPNSLLEEIYLEEIEDGLSVQMLHIGSYDSEEKSFNKMKDFIAENDLKITSIVHREIYLTDARKVSKEKLKTVLRYRVIRKEELK